MNGFERPEKVVYKEKEYVILESLDLAMLLVVEADKYENKEFPLVPLVIPNQMFG